MTDPGATFARALRVAAALIAFGAILRQLADPTTGDVGRQLLYARSATAALAALVGLVVSATRPARSIRLLALLIGLVGGGGAIAVLMVAPHLLLEQGIVITCVMLGAAVLVPWSWRWQAVLVALLVVATALALSQLPAALDWRGSGALRLLVTLILVGLASVLGAGLADRDRRHLAESEARYRSLFLAAGDAIAVLDPDGAIREGNPRLADLLGVPLAELLGRPLAEFYAADEANVRASGEFAAALTGRIHSGPRILVRPDGRRVQTDVTLARVERGAGPAVQAILHDLTDQRAVERRHEHQQRLAALASLAGGLAHQFNNVLGGILTHAAVLRADASQAHIQAELDEILAAARRGRDLAKELQRFTRQDPVSLRPTAPSAVLAGVAELSHLTLPDTITLDVQAAPDLPAMAADPDHLIHACLELVLNARDAMQGRRGRVTLAAALETVEERDPRWPGAAPGRYIRLSVTDTGVGMEPATLERVFEPFFTTKPMHQAAGLGLARVYRATRDHHGSARVESAPRVGTTVHVLVPVSTEPAAQPALPTPASVVPGAGVTVLIVDDEAIVRSSLRRALTRMGHRVFEASDGPTALAALQTARPPVDLVILDLVLPGGGAAIFELLKAVQPGLKVLLSSGYSPDEDLAKALAKRADGFLPKPYELGELRAALAQALGRAA